MTVEEAIQYAQERAKRFETIRRDLEDVLDIDFCERNADMLRTLCNEIERLRRQTGRKKK